MNPFKHLILAICFTNGMMTVASQEKKQPSANSLIFEDLPVGNTQKNSVLKANENPKDKISRNVFVKARANKHSFYFGESVRLTYELFTALQTKTVISQRPSLMGASGEDLKSDEAQSRHEMLNGKDFQTFTILQFKLKPFQPGELTVDPIVVNNSVEYADDDGAVHKYTAPVKSNAVKIYILPLPEENKPALFSGIVGKFEIKDTIENAGFAAGENNNLHIEIKGLGEYEDINLPSIGWPVGFDHFALHETTAGDRNKIPAEGKKVFDIPFVVGKPGHAVFPSIRFSYFDPSKKEYVQVQTPAIPLTIVAAAAKVPGKLVNGIPNKINPYTLWIAGFILSALIAAVVVLLRMRNIRKAKAWKLAEEAEMAGLTALIKPVDYRKDWETVIACNDDTRFLEKTREFLTKLMQEKFDSADVLEEDLLRHIKQPELMRLTGEIYSYCNRLLYAPVGLTSERQAITLDMHRVMEILEVAASETVTTAV
jgi:hypothetical protein